MAKYYISNPTGFSTFEEVTEEEWNKLVGSKEVSGYANEVYKNTISIEDVPQEYQETVKQIVLNKIEKWGDYDNQVISPQEFQKLLEGVL